MKAIKIRGVTIRYDDKNVKIVDSYRIKDKVQMEQILIKFVIETKYYSKRTITCWLKEWKAHNRLYKLGLFRSHTKDCDLEENEKKRKLIAYKILGI